MQNESQHMRKPNYTTLLAIIFSICFVVFAIAGIVWLVDNSTSTIDLLFTPASAIATIDGKEYKSGKITLNPGTHIVTVKKFGFGDQTKTIELKAGETISAYFIMAPNMEYTAKWYTMNENDAMISEGITSRLAEEENTRVQESFPIVKKLPVKTINFSIYRHFLCAKDSFCILIQAEPDKREEAIKFFKEKLDKDIGKYSFIFENHYNPFRGEG